MPEFYHKCKPSVRASILSIQFVNHLKEDETQNALILMNKSELKDQNIVSVDEDGKPCLLTASDLSKLFIYGNLTSKGNTMADGSSDSISDRGPLVKKEHSAIVAEFVNTELVYYLKMH